ncbi:MAG: hypothetical protein ABIP65_05145 [Vicinamibacterales bacterium]
MIDGTLIINPGGSERRVELAGYLDAAAETAAHQSAYAWIKDLRQIPVDGRSFRQRFTVRGDSLWWFSEIYLHKERAVLDIHRAIAATSALVERERPRELRVVAGSAIVRHVVMQLAPRLDVLVAGQGVSRREWIVRLARLDWRARMLTLSALAARLRHGGRPATAGGRVEVQPRIAAFIHRAFWRSGGDDGSAESYIGPVLTALEDSEGKGSMTYVGVGPSRGGRARATVGIRGQASGAPRVVPVEHYAPLSRLRESRRTWRRRRAHLSLLQASEGLRRAAVIHGVDCWPIVREQLAGIAWLQWPWSVRAMDEAAAALETLRPAIVLTYAEAGGWGRALMIEARRRNIPTVGLQHGFIYRNWLNYLHEADEMAADVDGGPGFPAPVLTLLFDAYAADHLKARGRFPPERLRVTGSSRLDAMMQVVSSFTPESLDRTRRDAGVKPGDALLLITTKEREARHALPAFLDAASAIPGVTVVIKPHPAETPDAYGRIVAGRENVHVAAATAPLGALLAASRAVVTVNSTVALDAAVAGVPAFVIGQPNNLSPFVEAGVFAGADGPQIEPMLRRILYDQGFRQQLSDARSTFLRQHAIASTGTAAARSASAVSELMRYGSGFPGQGD